MSFWEEQRCKGLPTAAGENSRSKHLSHLSAARSWRMSEPYRTRQRGRGRSLLPGVPTTRSSGCLRGTRPRSRRPRRPRPVLSCACCRCHRLLLLLLLRRLSSFAGACRATRNPFRTGGGGDAADLYIRRAEALRTAHLEHSRQICVLQAFDVVVGVVDTHGVWNGIFGERYTRRGGQRGTSPARCVGRYLLQIN